jgi:hypothetical protein
MGDGGGSFAALDAGEEGYTSDIYPRDRSPLEELMWMLGSGDQRLLRLIRAHPYWTLLVVVSCLAVLGFSVLLSVVFGTFFLGGTLFLVLDG